MRVLRLLDIRRARDHIATEFSVDDLQFQTTIWYADVDLDALAAQHGEAFDRICVHIALFELNTAISLAPDVIELGRYAGFLTAELAELWRRVAKHVWAQWRYDHDRFDYTGPTFVDPVVAMSRPIATVHGDQLLAMCGGGKDSLVGLRLLERAGLPFATLAYAHSIYGPAEPQHALIERVAGATGRTRGERQWVLDDLLDAPIPRLRPELGTKYILAAETPASVFAALPIALARGYRAIVVAHEASANTGNLTWHGEDVNHQWGKSWEAEHLLDAYVGRALVSGLRYFSILQPIHDEVIFELLARDPQLATLTHSCNTQKPWCGACAKCAYVWLQFVAHLPRDVVDATFGRDLGERPENDRWFRELLGLGAHTPFECVGSVPEARLAFALAAKHHALGPRLAALGAELGAIDISRIAGPLVGVGEHHGMPPDVAERVMPELRAAAAAAARRLGV